MQFASPKVLLLLLPAILLGAVLLRSFTARQKRFRAFISDTLGRSLLRRRQSQRVSTLELAIAIGAAVCIIVALARPQWGFTWKERSSSGVDIVLAVDVSSSMLATDIKPTRLAQARREITDLLAKLKGDRVGLVSFAGVAFTESPLTLDYSAFKLFLSDLNPDLLPVGGTNIQAALQESLRMLKGESSKTRAKAIVLITDGEEFDGDVSKVVSSLQELQVRLYVLGIGTPEGAPIPSARGYKKDKDGSVIVSRLRPDVLRKLAAESGGVFVQSVATEADIRQIYADGIEKQLEAKSIEWGSAKRWNEYFQLPLLLGICALLYIWMPDLAWKGFARTPAGEPALGKELRSLLILLLCPAVSTAIMLTATESAMAQNPPAQDSPATRTSSEEIDRIAPLASKAARVPLGEEEAEELGAEAYRAFSDAEYESSLAAFSKLAHTNGSDPRFLIGSAASLYRLGRFEEAANAYYSAAEQSTSPRQKAAQYFNAANSIAQLEKYKEASELYTKALELTPDDKEIIDNLAYVKKRIKEQDPQQNQDNTQENKKNSKSNSQQNKQQQESKKDSEKDSDKDTKNDAEKNNSQNNKNNSQQEQDTDKSQKPDSNEDAKDSSNQNQQTPQQDEEAQKDDNSSGSDTGQQQQDEENENTKAEGQSSPSDEENEESSKPKENDMSEQNRDGSGSPDSSGKENETKAEDELSSQELMLLKSVQEQRGAQIEFRAKKAVQQLKKLQQKLPEKDW